jgi:hypothetical protein
VHHHHHQVNRRIKEYETEKARLEAEALLPGVKGLKAKNLLAQLETSPLKEELNRSHSFVAHQSTPPHTTPLI